MKCERCGKELSGLDLYCDRCGQAVFPEYMDETDVWTYYKSDEELEAILEAEKENVEQSDEKKEDLKETVEEPVKVVEEQAEESAEEVLSEEIEEILEEEISEKTSEESKGLVEEEKEEEDTSIETEDIYESTEILEESPDEELSEEIPQEKEENVTVLPDESDQEWNFEDDEEEDDEPVITPAMKKRRRLRRVIITLFLIICLGAGLFIGYRRMAEMDQQEKAYYEKLNKSVQKEEDVPPEEPVKETPVEEPPAEEPSAEEIPQEETVETKQEYFISVDPEGIDFSQYTKLQPVSTEENSVKQSESYDYSARSAVDGDTSTSWQENEEGTGEGKGVHLNLDTVHKIRYIVLYLGNWRSDQLWDYNARPKNLTIQVGDQQVKDVEFSNEKKRFCISFDEPVEASYVSMYIKEAYEGSRWQDNCISEIEIYE